MTVVTLRPNLVPAPGRIGRFRFSKKSAIARHRWQDPERALDEKAITDLASRNILFVPVRQISPVIQQRIALAGNPFNRDLYLACPYLAFCPELDFLPTQEEPIRQRGLVFIDSMAVGDFISESLNAALLQRLLGNEFNDSIFINLETMDCLGLFILPPLFNNLAKLIAGKMITTLDPHKAMRFGFKYEHSALVSYLTNWKRQVAPRLAPEIARSGEELVQRFIAIAAANKDML